MWTLHISRFSVNESWLMSWIASELMGLKLLTAFAGKGVLLVAAVVNVRLWRWTVPYIRESDQASFISLTKLTACYRAVSKKYSAFVKRTFSPLFNISPLFGHWLNKLSLPHTIVHRLSMSVLMFNGVHLHVAWNSRLGWNICFILFEIWALNPLFVANGCYQ